MPRLVYLNGTLVDKDIATISVFDHGLLYGDGVFEGIRAYHGKVFEIDAHVERLWESAAAIMLKIPITKSQMKADIVRTLTANGLTDAYIRVIVTRGIGNLGLDPDLCAVPQVIIIVEKMFLYSDEAYEHGLEIVTVPTIRNHPQALDPRVKSLNYLNNILAKIEGKIAGAPEALMLNYKGHVAECSGDNIFTVRSGCVFTPSVASGILKGITRDVVIRLAQEAGLTVHEVEMTRYDLFNATECFLTGTAAEVIPVVRIDQRTIGDGKPGAVTLDLLKRFRDYTRL
jgi:branched-chain amino acid aminotransferase